MARRDWQRATYGAFTVAALVSVIALGIRFGWWRSYFGDPSKGVWPWVEAASWVLSSVLGALSLAVALRSNRDEAKQRKPGAKPEPGPEQPRDPSLLDREDEFKRLHRRLTKGPWGVVVVNGPAGIGKSKLVDAVLADIERSSPGLRVYRHTAVPHTRLDVRMLIADLEGRFGAPAGLRTGEPLLGRLEAALEATEQTRVVIVIESAQNLIYPGDRRHVDLQLDEALETIATNHRHRVAVVLVSQVPLQSQARGLWSSVEPPIVLGRLPYDDFVAFFATLDDKRVLGLAGLPEATRRMLHQQLQGNPRCAEFMRAIIMLSDRGFDVERIVATVARMEPKDAPQRLADMLVAELSVPRRRVLQALAAYAIPVDVTALAALLVGEASEAEIAGLLAALVQCQVVCVAPGGRYFLPPADVEKLLPRDASERSELLNRAADELAERRVKAPSGLDDLNVHFAELHALMLAHRYAVAFEVIELIAKYLNRWNCGFLLLEQREALQGQLGDPFLEMANDNELGDLHGERGSFCKASEAYGRALRYANEFGDPEIRTRIRANLGAMYWQNNEAENAYNYYELARAEAEAQGQLVVLMGALEGLADCHRRWGQYDLAIRRAEEALAVSARPDYTEIGTAGSARMVRIALRLARWYTEVGRPADASDRIETAERLAASRADPWLLVACLDCRADLLLSQNEIGLAIAKATDAVEQAVKLHDPVTILQARTTLCMAYLMQRDSKKAAYHIENADRYRRDGRALIVLAMRALVTQENDPARAGKLFDELAKQAKERIAKDEQDFGAHDMLGLAICGQRLNTEDTLDDAIVMFQAARDITRTATPGLLERRRFLVRRLDQYAQQPGRLRPVIDVLSGSRPAG